MGKRIKCLLVILCLLSIQVPSAVNAQAQNAELLITAIKLGGVVEGELTEYVEIYNQSETEIDLSQIKLEYAKPSAQINDCNGLSWKSQDSSSNVKEYTLSGNLDANSFMIIEVALNDNAGGSVGLVKENMIYDMVGWGNTVSYGVCKEGELTEVPESKKALMRYRTQELELVDTNNNKQDFTLGDPIIIDDEEEQADVCINLTGLQLLIPEGYELKDGICQLVMPEQNNLGKCKDVSLSEILPNPSGSDSGNEYIELYNANSQPIDLTDCYLKIGSSKKVLTGTIDSGYTAFYGLVLPNASGGSVEFITPTTEEVVEYPADLGDDVAWALVDNGWQATNRPTPNKNNLASLVEESSLGSKSTSGLGSCPAGKYRNPATNRCKNIESSNDLVPCKAGQYRNPATNRCKSTVEALTGLKPCKPGQYRNPATNRCKKADTLTTLKPCEPGQERNPQTNRCRKVAGVTTNTPNNELSNAVNQKQNMSYVVLAVIASVVLGYGAYEYRSDISRMFIKLQSRLKR